VARPTNIYLSNPLARAATVKNRTRPSGLAVYSAPADSKSGTQSRPKSTHRVPHPRETATIERLIYVQTDAPDYPVDGLKADGYQCKPLGVSANTGPPAGIPSSP
jgi:hypothetical protein